MEAEKGTFPHRQIAEVLLRNMQWSYSANLHVETSIHGIPQFMELLFYNSRALKNANNIQYLNCEITSPQSEEYLFHKLCTRLR